VLGGSSWEELPRFRGDRSGLHSEEKAMREQDSGSAERQAGLLIPGASLADEPDKLTRVLSASAAIGLALIILFGTAFAGPEIIHNAAHDVRHSFAFPCH
jgi:cobalt transporter subunit CbtB